jgi:hypothetical protein
METCTQCKKTKTGTITGEIMLPDIMMSKYGTMFALNAQCHPFPYYTSSMKIQNIQRPRIVHRFRSYRSWMPSSDWTET